MSTTPQPLTGNEQLGIQNLLAATGAASPFPTAPTDNKLSIEDFAQRIKTKYPEYAQMDNYDLASRVLKKYPEYVSHVAAQPAMPSQAAPFPAAMQPIQQPFGHTLAGPGAYLSDPAQELSRRVAGNLQPLQDTSGFLRNMLQQVKDYQTQRDPNPKGYGPFPGELVQGAKVLGTGAAQQGLDYAQNPSHLLGDILSAKIMAPEATSEAAEAVRKPISRAIPSTQRVNAAFQHLTSNLADLNVATEPRLQPHIDRVIDAAQSLVDRFQGTKYKDVPPMVSELIAQASNPSQPISWPRLLQFKTDLNNFIWKQESFPRTESEKLPDTHMAFMKTLAKTVDHSLRAGADLRDPAAGQLFSKANRELSHAKTMEGVAKYVGPVVGAGLGAAAGYPIGQAFEHPYMGLFGGKALGAGAGRLVAEPLARAITGRDVPPETLPNISSGRTTSASQVPISSAPSAMRTISPSQVISRSNAIAAAKGAPAADVASALTNLGFDKKAANLAVSTAARDNPGAGFNDLFREAHAKLRGPVAETTQTRVQPSTHEILNRMAAREQLELPSRITDPAESRPGAERRISQAPYSGPERRAPEQRGFETAPALEPERIGIDYRPAEDLGVKVREGTEAKMGPIKRGSKALAQAKALESQAPLSKAEQLAQARSGGSSPNYEDAVSLVKEFGKGSTSLLQRRLRISYSQAVQLLDRMEQEGIVGAAKGAGPREVLGGKGE